MQEVTEGQVWKDNDKRMRIDRYLRVSKIEGEVAICERVVRHPANNHWVVIASAKPSRISIKRMRPTATGYRLMGEAC